MKLRHAALAVSLVAVVAYVSYARSQDPAQRTPTPAPAVSAPAAAASPDAAEAPKVLYALGALLGQNVKVLNLTETELEQVKRGMVDAATGKKLEVDLQVYGPKLQQFGQSRMKMAQEAEKARGQAYTDKAAKEPGAVLTPSGLVYKEVTPGAGRSPAATDTVKVHYRGTLIDGTEFDSSIARNEPAEFPLNGVIPCWTEGVQRLKVGGKAKLVCPAAIAYGDQGRPPAIPGGATLLFDVELLEVKAAAAAVPPAAPAPAASPRPVPSPAAPAKPSPTPTPQSR
jgi:FKBP-type peptidyl-prolyl cis-trans isomerase FkpA